MPTIGKKPLAPNLKDVDDAELQSLLNEANAELTARKKAKEEILRAQEEKRFEKLRTIYKSADARVMIWSLFKHDRLSCSDENLANGFGSSEDSQRPYRCAKCALIELLEGQHFESDIVEMKVEILIHRLKV